MSSSKALSQLAERKPELASELTAVQRVLDGDDERALYRINPFTFAETHELDPRRTVDALLWATHAGVFRLSWGLLCQGCGSVVESFRTLGSLDDHFFCPDCNIDREAVLDDSVDVAFTVRPDVRAIRFHEPAALPLDEYFYDTYFGANILMKDTGERFVDYLRRAEALVVTVPPGGEKVVEVELAEGTLVGSPRHKAFVVGPRTDALQELELTCYEGIFDPYGETLSPGRVRLTLANPGASELKMYSYLADRVPYFAYRPFLSGKDLLNNATFRCLFKDQLIDISGGIAVRDVTLLFTDLKGSTAFYDRVGDAKAFELVTEHFRILGDVMGVHGGTVIKTMGDAVMASFSRPVDGITAALAGLRAITQFDRDAGAGDFGLKVGVHRGASIAVTVNSAVDYFGQTANIAARVQGCAEAGEVCVSQAVYEDDAVAKVLSSFGELPTETVELKGVSAATLIRRVRSSGR